MCQLRKGPAGEETVSMRILFGVLANGLIGGLVSVAQANPISPIHQALIEPLQPISKWEVIPSDTRCNVERSYGDSARPMFLAVHESISGKSFELIVTGAAKGPPRLEELQGGFDVGGDPIKRWSLHFVNDKGTSIGRFGLSPTEMSKVAEAHVVSFQAEGASNQSFALTELPDALRQLDECTARLRHDWRVDQPDSEAGIKGPRDDLRTPFATVAPNWRQREIRSGTVQFIVLVDETGKIADCDVQESADAPLLEEFGCALIRETIAQPAHDRSGKGVRDSFRSPPVIVP
jgi:hypothetical protein